jgi:flagellar protein FliS
MTTDHAMTAAETAMRRYLADYVETATPAQRLMLLFDSIANDFALARVAFGENNLEQVNNRLIHAQEILFALRDPLDQSSELGRSLASLYSFCLDRLIMANLRKEISYLDEVQPLVEQVASANRIVAAAMTNPTETVRA